MNAQAGGFLATPPALDGSPGLGIAGVTGIPRRARWVAVVTATAPEIPGTEVYFVTLADGSIVVDEDVPDGSLAPLADAVERSIPVPYRAEAARQEGDVWCVGADPVAIAALPATFEGDHVEQASYKGRETCSVDGESRDPLSELAAIGSRRGADYALSADRLDETTWVVSTEPL